MLLSRRPEDHVLLHDPYGVARLLGALRRLGASDTIAALLAREPENAAELTDAGSVASLLDELHKAGAVDAVASLARRVSGNVPVTDADRAARLLFALAQAGAAEAVASVAGQAAWEAGLTETRDTARLLRVLAALRMPDAVATVAARAAGQTALEDTEYVAELIDAMRRVGTKQALAALAGDAADAGHFAQLVKRGWRRTPGTAASQPERPPSPGAGTTWKAGYPGGTRPAPRARTGRHCPVACRCRAPRLVDGHTSSDPARTGRCHAVLPRLPDPRPRTEPSRPHGPFRSRTAMPHRHVRRPLPGAWLSAQLHGLRSRLPARRPALVAGGGEHAVQVKSATCHQRAGGEQCRLAHALGIFPTCFPERKAQKTHHPRNDHQEHNWQHSS